MLIVIVIISSAVAVRNIELYYITRFQAQALICTEINRKIVPARFLIRVYKTRRRSYAVSLRIRYRARTTHIFAIFVLDKRIHSITDPCGQILIGYIYPHTEFGRIFEGLYISLILKGCHHIAGFQ